MLQNNHTVAIIIEYLLLVNVSKANNDFSEF